MSKRKNFYKNFIANSTTNSDEEDDPSSLDDSDSDPGWEPQGKVRAMSFTGLIPTNLQIARKSQQNVQVLLDFAQ